MDHLPLKFSLVSKIYPTSPSRAVCGKSAIHIFLTSLQRSLQTSTEPEKRLTIPLVEGYSTVPELRPGTGTGSPFSSVFYGWVRGREGGTAAASGPNSVKTHFKQRWRRKTKRKGGWNGGTATERRIGRGREGGREGKG